MDATRATHVTSGLGVDGTWFATTGPLSTPSSAMASTGTAVLQPSQYGTTQEWWHVVDSDGPHHPWVWRAPLPFEAGASSALSLSR